MKRILLLSVACLMLGTAANAQNWTFGAKAGMNVTGITDDDIDMGTKFSFHLGAFAEYRFNDFFGVQPELIYSRQGAYEKENGIKGYARFNYINVPILAKLYVTEGLSIDLGPQFGILLNSKAVAKGNGDTIKSDWDGSKGFDVSFAMGLTYSIDYHWSINARYNLGLTNVDKDFDGKNSVFQIGVGYRF